MSVRIKMSVFVFDSKMKDLSEVDHKFLMIYFYMNDVKFNQAKNKQS